MRKSSLDSRNLCTAKVMKKKIFIFGNFGSGNLGNEATLQVTLHHLRRLLPAAAVTCVCTDPETVEAAYHAAAVPIRPVMIRWTLRNRAARWILKLLLGVPCEIYRWLRCLVMLWGADALLIPGTGVVTDACGLVHWGPYGLFQWAVAAKLVGCKVLFISVGAGPLYSHLGRVLVRSAMALADFRSYRDASSLQYLETVGFRRRDDRVYPDLVFSLPEVAEPRLIIKSRARAVVGLGLMGYAGRYNVEKPKESTYINYINSLVGLVGWLFSCEYDVRLLDGDIVDAGLHEHFINSVKDRLSTYDSARIIDVPAVSVEQLFSQLATTDLVVATRFHNALMALLLNKPVISISFHHKCVSLMSDIGLSEYCLDINDLRAEELIERFCRLAKNTDFLKPIIRERVVAYRKALDEQYETILAELCPEPPGAARSRPRKLRLT